MGTLPNSLVLLCALRLFSLVAWHLAIGQHHNGAAQLACHASVPSERRRGDWGGGGEDYPARKEGANTTVRCT